MPRRRRRIATRALQQLRALGVDEATIAALRDSKDMPELQAAIRAPIEGTVVERLINPGQLLQAGSTPAFTIANLVDDVGAGERVRVRPRRRCRSATGRT